jgi:plasmid stabilization system protein ParE
MTRIELAPAVFDDFDRILAHLSTFGVADASSRIAEIIDAIQVLSHSPLIGRPVRAGKRELVIGHGAHGYIALYRHVPDIDTVFILAIRGQRESGFKHGP